MIPCRPATAVAAALVADALFGEPPEPVHPTVLMGRAIFHYERGMFALLGPDDAHRLRLAGLALALALPTLSFTLAHVLLRRIPSNLRWPAEVTLLSMTVSMRGLARAARTVEDGLERNNMEGARARAREIVGRDTERLSPNEVARAAVESVAENASDGVVAPMLYGLVLGAPGALAYKAINTLDSMVGHESPPHKDFGLASARLDDLANLLPARLTALAAAAVSGRFLHAWRVACAHGPRTASPNAGWAESAFAGALGLTLGGANSYGGVTRQSPILGAGRAPEAADIGRAVRLMRRACYLLAALSFVPLAARGLCRG